MTNISDGAFAVIFNGRSRQQVFLVYRSDKPIWNLPGGGIENRESPEAAAIRETLEETGFHIELTKKVGVYRHIDIETGGVWNYSHLFIATISSGTFQPEFPGCKGEWFDVGNLPRDIQPVTLQRITDALQPQDTPFMKDFIPGAIQV